MLFRHDGGHAVRCIISIENFSRWNLSNPRVLNESGEFQYGFHAREILPARREIVVSVDELNSTMGSSGAIAWEIRYKNTSTRILRIYLIVSWDIPYNLLFDDAKFGFRMIGSCKPLTSDMLFRCDELDERLITEYKRGRAGELITCKNPYAYIVGNLAMNTYHPVMNISVLPTTTKNFAPSIRRQLYQQFKGERSTQHPIERTKYNERQDELDKPREEQASRINGKNDTTACKDKKRWCKFADKTMQICKGSILAPVLRNCQKTCGIC